MCVCAPVGCRDRRLAAHQGALQLDGVDGGKHRGYQGVDLLLPQQQRHPVPILLPRRAGSDGDL